MVAAVLCQDAAPREDLESSEISETSTTTLPAKPNDGIKPKKKPANSEFSMPLFGIEQVLGSMWPYRMDSDDSDDALETMISQVGRGLKTAGDFVSLFATRMGKGVNKNKPLFESGGEY